MYAKCAERTERNGAFLNDMNDYIEIINYTATTTATDGTATTTTAGQYVIPFLLFQFVAIVFTFTIMAVTIYILTKRK